MIRVQKADLVGASGVYSADGAFRVRVFVSNDEGAFDVWARTDNGTWDAEWPATLADDRTYKVRAELWRRKDHADFIVDPNFSKHFYLPDEPLADGEDKFYE